MYFFGLQIFFPPFTAILKLGRAWTFFFKDLRLHSSEWRKSYKP